MTIKPLIVMALASESQGKIEAAGFEVLYCGIGKVNATFHLTRYITERKALGIVIPMIINLGSAGSHHFKTGALVECTAFVQRDMDTTGLGFAHGETPFDNFPLTLSVPSYFPSLEKALCGSGDSFLQDACPMKSEVVEMEAYALAKVCAYENIPFACAKYITDGADSDAHTDWEENLKHAADAFVELLNNSSIVASATSY